MTITTTSKPVPIHRRKTFGLRLYEITSKMISEIGGEELPTWNYLSDAERGAWEAQALHQFFDLDALLEIQSDPNS